MDFSLSIFYKAVLEKCVSKNGFIQQSFTVLKSEKLSTITSMLIRTFKVCITHFVHVVGFRKCYFSIIYAVLMNILNWLLFLFYFNSYLFFCLFFKCFCHLYYYYYYLYYYYHYYYFIFIYFFSFSFSSILVFISPQIIILVFQLKPILGPPAENHTFTFTIYHYEI